MNGQKISDDVIAARKKCKSQIAKLYFLIAKERNVPLQKIRESGNNHGRLNQTPFQKILSSISSQFL